jgi:hypothetical protein
MDIISEREDLKMSKDSSNNIISLSDAQKLFNMYSPFKTNNDLKDILFRILGQKYENEVSPRERINTLLINNYPNETVIKSSFINDVILKSNNHVTIFELNVGSSRADLCKINGSSIAYEIKTDLDNIQRLDKQLNDYLKVFEKIYVICSENKFEQINKNVMPECGIYTYRKTRTGIYRFKKVKEALISNQILPLRQLAILTKRELSFNFSIDNKLSREQMYQDILNVHNNDQINLIFKKCLKIKYHSEWQFIRENNKSINEIDYQWFFKYMINPEIVYK